MNERKDKNKEDHQRIEGSDNEPAHEEREESGQSQNEQSSQINYQDIFQQARREDVLRDINQENSQAQIQVLNEDVEQVLNKRTKREQKRQEYNKMQQMKRLRQQNAVLFFRKVKIEILLSFNESIQKVKRVFNTHESKVARLLSECSLGTLSTYHSLKSLPAFSRKRRQFINLVLKIFNQDKIELKQWNKYQIIWCLAVQLGLPLRKICFIDISDMELESFYNLKYLAIKTKKKSLNKQIDILKNKLQRRVVQQELKDKNFIGIEEYAFNPKAHMQLSKTQSTQSSRCHQTNSRSLSNRFEQIKEMKKTFIDSFCQIYCPVQDNWELFNLEVLETQQLNQVKNTVLEGKAIIGFYSARIIQFKDQFKILSKERMTNYIEIRDQTIHFCDKYELIAKRRNRLGCKSLYKNMMREANIFKNLQIFEELDQILIEEQRKKQLEWAQNNFPKSVKQMKISDYFVTPSLVEKYMMIRQGAKPIENLQFHEQKVYYKSDLERVSSRMGWVDCSRMVKDDEIPIKTTQNKNKSTTKLYKFSQTQPFKLKFDSDRSLLLDEEYNSIYVPPHFQIPQSFCLVQQNVEYLCKKNKLKCARIVQGFDVAGSHVVPNNIGYLVQEKHKDQILKNYTERQEKLRLKKQQRKVEDALSLWRKLFKSIIVTQQVYSQ